MVQVDIQGQERVTYERTEVSDPDQMLINMVVVLFRKKRIRVSVP